MSIAIIGMGLRFPGADDVQSYWRNISQGIEAIDSFSAEQLDLPSDTCTAKNSDYIKRRGQITAADGFDCRFFGFSPAEAALLDPQQRVFIETCWHALEDAGCNPENYKGNIGVFGGTGTNSYLTNNILKNSGIIELFGEHAIHLANGPDYLTTRVSHLLNLKGPSIGVYSGCSLSLVATALSCDMLMNYGTDIALAGGSFICSPLKTGYYYREGEIYSKDGYVRPFDEAASGTVFSNGCGVVALKRYEDAIKDGDRIYAVIKGWALNNDGSHKISYTAPSVDGQAEVVEMALAHADVEPGSIGYIETHGTGTSLGDPVEIAALHKVYKKGEFKQQHCALGSVKANIGHLDAAAGVAGLMKAALVLYHKKIPPLINFSRLNPAIDFSDSPFFIPASLKPWLEGKTPRRAATTSLGVGGTNAHVILEEVPSIADPGVEKNEKLHLLVWSGKSASASEQIRDNLSNFLDNDPQPEIGDIAFTLQSGRRHFSYRGFALATDLEDARSALTIGRASRCFSGYFDVPRRNLVFLFPGQGSQYPMMMHDLYKGEMVFKESVDRCASYIVKAEGIDIRDFIFPATGRDDRAVSDLSRTSITQIALFTVEYALFHFYKSCGLIPTLMLGHSLGELTAACCADVFSLEDACYLILQRGKLMESMQNGAMLAIQQDVDSVRNMIDPALSVAAVNAPDATVISGTVDAIAQFRKRCDDNGIPAVTLKTSHAFHSSMMDPILEAFGKVAGSIKMSRPSIPFLSNVTGCRISDNQAVDPSYWVKQLRSTVLFSDGLSTLFEQDNSICLEVGPGMTLTSLVNRHPGRKKTIAFSATRHHKEEKNDRHAAWEALGKLWINGWEIDWKKIDLKEKHKKVSLPLYPFERQQCWIKADGYHKTNIDSAQGSQLLQKADIPCDAGTISLEIEPGKGHIIEILTGIWKSLLGFDAIDINSNFFGIGGTSLLAASLFKQIELKLHKKLPLATLYAAPTIRLLAEALSVESPDVLEPWSPLVTIKEGADEFPPLFLVHGAGGNVLLYHALAEKLPETMRVYGLQSQGLDGKKPFNTTIEAMASCYLSEVQRVQPNGPYVFAGYCLGGSIALEMARQLEQQGKATALLALFETYDFSTIGDITLKVRCAIGLQKIKFHVKNFLNLQKADKKLFLREKTAVAKERMCMLKGKLNVIVPKTVRSGQATAVSLINEIWKINDAAAFKYIPGKYNGRTVQFLPAEDYIHHQGAKCNMAKIGGENVISERLPIFPAGMLIKPFVQTLADKLVEHIQMATKGNN